MRTCGAPGGLPVPLVPQIARRVKSPAKHSRPPDIECPGGGVFADPAPSRAGDHPPKILHCDSNMAPRHQFPPFLTHRRPRDMLKKHNPPAPAMSLLDLRIASPDPFYETVGYARDLTAEDVALAKLGVVAHGHTKKLSERHHAVARALAKGMPIGMVADLFGYTTVRLRTLQDSPAFKDLMAIYQDEEEQMLDVLQARMLGLAREAVGELHTRLEESPEKVTTPQLLQILTVTADRVGHGPSSRQEVNVNLNLAARLDAARQRARAAMLARDVTPDE